MRYSLVECAVADAAPWSQGNIAQWNVKVGQAFSAGDVLAEVETDKATMGWESQDDGVMAKIILPAGTKDIEVGTLVALTVDDASELEQAQNYQPGSGGGGGAAPAEKSKATESAPSGPSSAFPAHQVWTMPALSPTMTQGNIAKWYKQVGDAVNAGDALVEVETDKATMMWESVEEGYIAKILAPDGTQDIQVLACETST
jgi:pyruvate dehydrogenase E2 component (dihydrolipoamide acetyltransferase)